MKNPLITLLFSLLATSVVIASDLPKFDPPPDEVVYRGVTEEQWETISSIGDPLNCRQQVFDLQNLDLTEFHELKPEDCKNDNCINVVLKNNDKIILREGIYKSKHLHLNNKVLIGYPNERIIIHAIGGTAVTTHNSIVSNLIIQNAGNIGVRLFKNNLIYRVVVGNTGLYYKHSYRGIGFNQKGSYGSENNCIVSAEAYNGYNYKSSYGAGINGGAADGFDAKFLSSKDLTFIDSHSHHNSDGGFDFYCSGNVSKTPLVRMYYSSAIKSKNPFKSGGDGTGIKVGGEPNEPECDRKVEKSTPRILYSTVSCYSRKDFFNPNNVKITKINDTKDPYRFKCSDFKYINKIANRSFDIPLEIPIVKKCNFNC